MRVHHITFIAALLLAGQMANAQSTVKNEAQKKHETCVNSGAGVPTQLAFLSCITAFDALIIEAQKKHHSPQRQRLYWAQAGQSAGLSLLMQMKIDNAQTIESALTPTICKLALSSLQAYSQIQPPGKADDVDELFVPADYLTNIHNQCIAKKTP